MKADELADIIAEKRIRAKQRAYDSLKEKVLSSTSRMIADLDSTTELDLSDDDILALVDVTERLRELGYKFRFIEVQDPSGNVLKQKLHISIAHLL